MKIKVGDKYGVREAKITEALIDLRKQKQTLENDLCAKIRHLLDDFRKTTGLQITKIQVNFVKTQVVNSRARYGVSSIETYTDLDAREGLGCALGSII